MVINKESNESISLNQLLNILNTTIKNVYDCIVIDDNDEIIVDDIIFDKILKIHGDRTVYEASVNELRVNDYINGDKYDFNNILALGFTILDSWENRLKKEYPDRQFCLIIGSIDGNVTLRFHQVSENESKWLSEDLEGFQDAVAYRII